MPASSASPATAWASCRSWSMGSSGPSAIAHRGPWLLWCVLVYSKLVRQRRAPNGGRCCDFQERDLAADKLVEHLLARALHPGGRIVDALRERREEWFRGRFQAGHLPQPHPHFFLK